MMDKDGYKIKSYEVTGPRERALSTLRWVKYIRVVYCGGLRVVTSLSDVH